MALVASAIDIPMNGGPSSVPEQSNGSNGTVAKKQKPARKQVKAGEVEKAIPEQTGKEYNIWYNKWAGGDREDNYSNKVKSQTRCNIRRDAGWTRADTTGIKYCCLFFARGCCPYGYECQYLHRLPHSETVLPDSSLDCFARGKFSDYRDDMGGVGSFNRQNRTLYVGRIRETGPGHETEEIVLRHFREWGEVDRIRVLQHRSVAFVTYVSELHAQFAKEAMACQSLDNDEILNVRWATEDPNPTQKVAEHERLVEVGQAAISGKLDQRIVDAVQAVKMLEEAGNEEEAAGDEELEFMLPEEIDAEDEEAAQQEDGVAASNGKRAREEDEESAPSAGKRVRAQSPPKAAGLLNAETMEGLKYFAEIRKRQAEEGLQPPTKAPAPKPMGLLADYGSDEDDDE